MNPLALEKASSRARIARKAIEDLTSSKSYQDFSDNWYVFLTASKNVYTVLEQGAKDSPQSRQWFGQKQNERRADPLLQYVYEARNDDEHGLGSSVEHVNASDEIGVSAPGYSNSIRLDGTDRMGNTFNNVVIHDSGGSAFSFGPGQAQGLKFTSLDGLPIKTKRTAAHAKLINVNARGRILPPPQTHRGQPITDKSPVAVANAALIYLEGLISEAGKQ